MGTVRSSLIHKCFIDCLANTAPISFATPDLSWLSFLALTVKAETSLGWQFGAGAFGPDGAHLLRQLPLGRDCAQLFIRDAAIEMLH